MQVRRGEDEMNETLQRILGYVKGKQPLAVQATTAKKLATQRLLVERNWYKSGTSESSVN